MTIILMIFFIIVNLISYVIGYNIGFKKGCSETNENYEEQVETPLAGQIFDLTGFGKVMILGDGTNNNGIRTVDTISLRALNRRLPTDLDSEELERNTISYPLAEFVNQSNICYNENIETVSET